MTATISGSATSTLVALTTTGNTILGDASTDTLNVGNGDLVKDASGNVGIGTASPQGKFNVGGGRSNFGANSEIYSIGVGYSQARVNSAQTYYMGATDSATPELVFSNAAGTVQARIETGGNLLFNSGYGSAATAYGCRAWVNFNGTGTVAIRASGNVSSITDSGAGRYTVNFTTAMVDANYATQVTIVYSILLPATLTAATTSIAVTVDTVAGVPTDVSVVSVSVFR
jgi:hypothetical protein